MKTVKKAVIPVAGFGTRFLPFTKTVSKMMLPIIDTPVLELIVEEAAESGIEEILFIVGRHGEQIEDYFTDNEELNSKLEGIKGGQYLAAVKKVTGLAEFSFVTQTEQKGTAHAVALAKDFVRGEPFLLMFGDDLMRSEGKPVSKQLIEAYEATGKTVLGCKKVPLEDVPKYASAEYDRCDGRTYYMTKITEKPPISQVKSNLAPLGRYVCAPEIFDYIDKLTPGAGGEYQITDAFDMLAREGKAVAYDFEGTRYDAGDKFGYLTAVIDYALGNEEYKDRLIEYISGKKL